MLHILKKHLDHTLRLKLALRLVWRSAPKWASVNIGLILVQGPLPLLSLYLLKLLFDAVAAGLTAPDRDQIWSHVVWLLLVLGAVTIGEYLVNALANLVNTMQTQEVTDYVQELLHQKSIEVDLAYYENPQYYDTLHRAQQEAPYRPTSILNNLIQIGRNGVSLIAMIGLLTSLHWAASLILIAVVLPELLFRVQRSGRIYRWQRERTPTQRKMWYFNWLLTTDRHAKELRVFDIGDIFRQRFHEFRTLVRQEKLSLETRRTIASVGVQVLAALVLFSVYGLIAYRTVQGQMTPGDLVMYYQAFQRGQTFLRGILGSLAQLYEDNLFLANLEEFLALTPTIRMPDHPRPMPRPMQHGIEFDQVGFGYPGSDRMVLEEISLTIRPGEKIALVGENGAGKTTLIKLLCRLYDPTAGAIRVDGVDLRELDLAALRREISVIFQDYGQYNLTARENIWLGDIQMPPDDPRIIAAARAAGADPVIARLKQGYDTLLGKWFEDGVDLSIGQWQKIALARAFLRQTQILVLDEPTSALDAKAEYNLFQQMQRLTENRAALLISHRFSTVRMADCIYVLAEGRILERGSHAELMKQDGLYAHMFNLQARQYQ